MSNENTNGQPTTRPRPETLFVIAAGGLALLASGRLATRWVKRTVDDLRVLGAATTGNVFNPGGGKPS